MAALSYGDAVRVMGADSPAFLEHVDQLLGGVIIASSTVTGAGTLGLIGPKNELMRLTKAQLKRVSSKKYSALDRTHRVEAAHTILVVAAFFEAATELLGHYGDAEFMKRDGWQILGGDEKLQDGGIVERIASTIVPTPEPHLSYFENAQRIKTVYQDLATQMTKFITGLAFWDSLTETDQDRVTSELKAGLPDLGMRRYEESVLKLSTEIPEFALWTQVRAAVGTQSLIGDVFRSVDRIETGLGGLKELFAAMGQVSGLPQPMPWLQSLATKYAAFLENPIADVDLVGTTSPVKVPSVARAYVNPHFRLAEATVDASPSQESWWEARTVQTNVQEFLAGYVTTTRSRNLPMLILGHPGSGKSVLSRVLAARLPKSRFTAVRVPLRSVDANASIVRQIEQALELALNENVKWSDFSNTCGESLPLIIMDGFDELLQATGVSRYDYLTKIAEFQATEASRGRSAAVIVTSRTVVADRVAIPKGCVLVKIEPFSGKQIELWLHEWNQVNREGFRAAGIEPLDSRSLREHYNLASQPILLLILALYDSDGNPLQASNGVIGRAKLYRELFERFVRREIEKDSRSAPLDTRARLVNEELYKLTLVAFGMFNRGRQVIREVELNQDLDSLLPAMQVVDRGAGFFHPLSRAQRTLGRFFFVHLSEATLSDPIDKPMRPSLQESESLERSYEFLHATFGEYLIARAVLQIFADMRSQARAAAAASFGAAEETRDAMACSLLSFQPLSNSPQILEFLQELACDEPEEIRSDICELVRDLAIRADNLDVSRTYDQYGPPASYTERVAAYTANLCLAMLTIGPERAIGIDSTKTQTSVPHAWWTKTSRLWRACFTEDAWSGILAAMSIDYRFRYHDEDDIATVIQRGGNSDIVTRPSRSHDPSLGNVITPAPEWGQTVQLSGMAKTAWQTADLTQDVGAIRINRYVESIRRIVDDKMFLWRITEDDETPLMLPAIALQLRAHSVGGVELLHRYEVALDWLSHQRDQGKFAQQVLNRLPEDSRRLPAQMVGAILNEALAHAPFEADPEFFTPIVVAGIRTLRHADLETRTSIEGHIVAALGRLDLVHFMDEDHRRCIDLIVEILQNGYDPEVIIPEFGGIAEWTARLDLHKVATEDSDLAARVIRFAREAGVHFPQGLRDAMASAMSDDALRMLSVEDMQFLSGGNSNKDAGLLVRWMEAKVDPSIPSLFSAADRWRFKNSDT